MGKKSYKLINVVHGSKIILGDKRGFGKSKQFYEELNRELKADWTKRHSVPATERKTEFETGEHVLAKSRRCEGPRRAVILDVDSTSEQERSYTVFVYDEGVLEDLPEHRITVLSEARKDQLEPRAVIVQLPGIVPCRVIIDLAKQALDPDGDSYYVVSQASSWQNKAIRLVREWLESPSVKSLGIKVHKSNEDVSVWGDIYRKFHSRALDESFEVEEASKPDEDEAKDKKSNRAYLSTYMQDNRIGLFNDDLYNSQTKIRVPDPILSPKPVKVEENEKDLLPDRESDAGPEKNYDEEVLALTRKPLPVIVPEILPEDTSEPVPDDQPTPSTSKIEVDTSFEELYQTPPTSPSLPEEPQASIHDFIDGPYDDTALSPTRCELKTLESRVCHPIKEKRVKSAPKGPKEKLNADYDDDLRCSVSSTGSASTSTSGSIMSGLSLLEEIVINTASDSMSKAGINVPGRLLVRGKHVRAPYTKQEEFRLPNSLTRSLKAVGIGGKDGEELNNLHKAVAPNFVRGSDLIVIYPESGRQHEKNVRVLSYILPLLRFTLEKYERFAKKEDDKDPPETLIIVNSYNTGINVEHYINQLLVYSQDLPIRVKFLSKDAPEYTNPEQRHKKKLIPGGIDVMIMTMSYLSTVMQTTEGSSLFEKLRFLIFEELDLYLKSYKEDMQVFINAARQNLKINYFSLPFQIVFSGCRWSAEMEDLYKAMVTDRAPVVFINGPNQALRYAKMRWQIYYLEEENRRLEKLNDIFKSHCVNFHKRIVIACSTAGVAVSVYDSLKMFDGADGVQFQLMISGIPSGQIYQAQNLWNKNTTNVLIISDDMMHKVDVSNGTCLICYDSPLPYHQSGTKRPIAAERFGYLWANIRHIEVEQLGWNSKSQPKPEHNPRELVAHFLMTGEEPNFYQMYKFANSLGNNIEFPQELKDVAAMIEREGLPCLPMCPGIKLFGFCNYSDPATCPARHCFIKDELSVPPSVPHSGELEIRIVKCLNPSSYQAELIRHYEITGGKRVFNRSYLNEASRRKALLAKHFGGTGRVPEECHVKPINTVEPGSWCAVMVRDQDPGYFARAKIEKIQQKDKHGNPLTVRVNCIDSGLMLNPAASQLYELPPECQDWPPLVVNLILSHLQPLKKEKEYRQYAERKAKSVTTGKIYNAKIWLAVGNTVWVNPMVEYHVNPKTKMPSRGESVRYALLTDKVVDYNAAHLDVLFESVQKYPGVYKGPIISRAEATTFSADEAEMIKQKFHQCGDEVQWAFVEKSRENKFDPAKIVTQFGYDPWVFFGVHDKFYDELRRLEKELNEWITKCEAGTGEFKLASHKHLFEYEPGMVVAVKERQDQTWMRGFILHRYFEEPKGKGGKKEEYFEVFFADYGDTCEDVRIEEMFPMPRRFVSQLPLQAIAFKLEHVQPIGGGELWTEAANDLFCDTIVPNERSIDVQLLAFENAEDETDSLPCRYYNAVAFFHNGEQELGSHLVEKGVAEWKPGKEHVVSTLKDKLLSYYNTVVNRALDLDEEDEDEGYYPRIENQDVGGGGNYDSFAEVEEFDIHVGGLELANIFPVNERQQAAIMPLSPSNESREPSASTSGAYSSVSNSCGAPAVAIDKDGLLHPQVYYRQTGDTFVLTINLPDIREYEAKLFEDKCTFEFKTVDKSPNYGFKIKVYGKVDPEYAVHLTGQYMRITFRKRFSGVNWPRALFSKAEKYSWLKGDLEHVAEEEEQVAEDERGNKLGKYVDSNYPVEDDLENDIEDQPEDWDMIDAFDSNSSDED